MLHNFLNNIIKNIIYFLNEIIILLENLLKKTNNIQLYNIKLPILNNFVVNKHIENIDILYDEHEYKLSNDFIFGCQNEEDLITINNKCYQIK